MVVETTRASLMWTGPEKDVLMLFREPTPLWMADLVDEDSQFFVLLTLDEDEQETGEISGIEILDFLTFDRWDAIPDYPIRWEVEGWGPFSMVDLLKRAQIQIRKESETPVSAG